MLKTETHTPTDFYLHAIGLAYKLDDAAKKHLGEYLHQYHIKFAHWYLLKSIMFDDATMPSALALCMGTDRAAVTRLLDDLEFRSLVVREQNTEDRRVVTVKLTKNGMQVIQKGIDCLIALPNLLLQRLNSKELGMIRQLETHYEANRSTQH